MARIKPANPNARTWDEVFSTGETLKEKRADANRPLVRRVRLAAAQHAVLKQTRKSAPK